MATRKSSKCRASLLKHVAAVSLLSQDKIWPDRTVRKLGCCFLTTVCVYLYATCHADHVYLQSHLQGTHLHLGQNKKPPCKPLKFSMIIWFKVQVKVRVRVRVGCCGEGLGESPGNECNVLWSDGNMTAYVCKFVHCLFVVRDQNKAD